MENLGEARPTRVYPKLRLSDDRDVPILSRAKRHSQEGIVDVDVAVVLNEAQSPEFVHKQVDPTSS